MNTERDMISSKGERARLKNENERERSRRVERHGGGAGRARLLSACRSARQQMEQNSDGAQRESNRPPADERSLYQRGRNQV